MISVAEGDIDKTKPHLSESEEIMGPLKLL